MRLALAVMSLLVGLPLCWFWLHRTRNVVANLTTNERYNLRRYAHFKRADGGGFANPFDRGVAGNCAFFFLAPCGCAAKHGGGGGSGRTRINPHGWRQPLIDDDAAGFSDALTAVKPMSSTSSTRAGGATCADRV